MAGKPEEDSGNSPYMPSSPDPTAASAAAVTAAAEASRREIRALRELHDKDLAALKELLDARIAGMDTDRGRLWERSEDLVRRFTAALTDFRAEVERRDQANRGLIEQRLTDLDKARQLAADQIRAIPAAEREQLTAEREYHMTKLDVLATRTDERFKAVDKGFAASKEAVAAALQAAKEAVTEQNRANSAAIKVSEGNTKEQLTALSQVSSANFRALEDKITDARDRVTAIESLTRGIKEAGTETRADKGISQTGTMLTFVAIATLISLAALLVTVFFH